MKKLLLLFAVATMAVSAQAQTVTESKTFDNFYVGINGGVATKATGHAWLKGLNPNAGLRIGRWFTPVFGLAVESLLLEQTLQIDGNGCAFPEFESARYGELLELVRWLQRRAPLLRGGRSVWTGLGTSVWNIRTPL